MSNPYSFSYKVNSLNCYPTLPAGEYKHAILKGGLVKFKYGERTFTFEIPSDQVFNDDHEHVIPQFTINEKGYLSYLTKDLYQNKVI